MSLANISVNEGGKERVSESISQLAGACVSYGGKNRDNKRATV